jgi:hypothetical protein
MNSYIVVWERRNRVLFPWIFGAIATQYSKVPFTAVVPCAAFLFVALAIPGVGQMAVGIVRGTTSNFASGKPVAEVQIIAHNLDKGGDRFTITKADGSFTLKSLEPGRYELAASKNGFQKSSTRVEVGARGATRADLPLHVTADLGQTTEQSDSPPLTGREKQLLERIDRLEERLSAMEAKNAGATRAAAENTAAAAFLVASATPVAYLPEAAPLRPTLFLPDPAPAPSSPQAVTSTPTAPVIPEPLHAPKSTPGVDTFTPFAYGDFTWLNGSPRNNPVLDTKFFTAEIRFDTHFMTDFNQPIDHTMGGSTESFRSGEFQLEQVSVGGDFHWENVRGRLLTMNGLFATTTPRNDASAGVGQWHLPDAYRYFSEAWGGYHFNVQHGLNIDAGIFVSYIGLFSYYNFDNWTYQPSFVSSNTPWFFNGLRFQWFPTNKLKIEPWIINGWQSYARFNGHHGFGGQILYMPREWLKLVFNNYGNGTDTLGNPNRVRIHTDDSIEVRYYNKPQNRGVSRMAFTLTGDLGCEYGGGVTCHGGKGGPKQAFLGWMAYDRSWFHKDLLALTIGGGMMNNPGRYLTLLPPINGADAVSGSPYFTANPGDKAHMWDGTINLQYMPKQFVTWWLEAGYRHSDVPYWSGRHGITPPGGNTGAPSQYVCASGGSAGTADLATAFANCGGPGSVWFPDLRRGQAALSAGVMVKF